MVDHSFKKYHLKLKALGEGIFYKYDLDLEQLQKYVDAYHYAQDILINGKTISSGLVDAITIMESENTIIEYENKAKSEIRDQNQKYRNSNMFRFGYRGDPKEFAFSKYFQNVTDDFIVHTKGELKKKSITNKTEIINKTTMKYQNNTPQKIFISHATKDQELVGEFLELLEGIGLNSDQIFCSSFEGYGIPLGENFLDRIKQELSSEVLVLFVITNNFYESKVCLCEMGAAWALSKRHIPIVVPPLSYDDIQGVIPLTQGLSVNDVPKLNSLKEKLEKDFGLQQINLNSWERKRDKFIRNISKLID